MRGRRLVLGQARSDTYPEPHDNGCPDNAHAFRTTLPAGRALVSTCKHPDILSAPRFRSAVTYKRAGIIRDSDSEDDRQSDNRVTRRKIVRPYKRHRGLQLRYGQGGRKVHRRDAGENSDFLKRLRKAGLNLGMIAGGGAALTLISTLMMVMAGRFTGGRLSTRYITGWARAQNRAT